MGRGPAVSQEPFTACASSPYPLRTPPGSSASIASKPAILAKIMHRRPAADLSDRGPIFGAMHAVCTPSDPGAADKGFYWNSLPFGEFLWIRMGIHLRIYKDSPNSTEFQGMNRTPFFDPKKGVPYQRLSPQSGSDGNGTIFQYRSRKYCKSGA